MTKKRYANMRTLTKFLGVAAALTLVATPAAANTDATIQNNTFYGIGGTPSGYGFNNQSPGVWDIFLCVTCSTTTYEYKYTGQPFTTNLLPGATYVSVNFFSPSLLTPSTNYGVSSAPFQTMTISDGVNVIPVGGGSFLNASFLETNNSGNISRWQIAELTGASRPFVLVNVCCTIGDVPLISTYNSDGPVGIPGPIAGAGLPGLVFLCGGLLAWWRRTTRRDT